ncbi:MAG: nitroreductase family protein [Bacteroidetes Order II. Incertae sedis bacterium]|nr:nitroreductase family protein [Bacteroidetes Order II. bacterium]
MENHPTSPHIPLAFERLPEAEMTKRASDFFQLMNKRRSVRFFSDAPVPRVCIERAIQTAGTAPSGAHRQPWKFVAISNASLKHQLRVAVEAEERRSYESRMPQEWLKALAPIGTNWEKPFLEQAPWLVVCFEEVHGVTPDGGKQKNYYVQESCGIACGLFIAAIHHMGLVTLTHTPSPMGFLSTLLKRPANERPFMLFPVGYPAMDATVPDFARKPLAELSVWYE